MGLNHMDFFDDIIAASENSYRAKDDQKLDIAIRKREYEKTLDGLYDAYSRFPVQYVSKYRKQLDIVKGTGCRVLRNSAGRHKIVVR